jgi:Gas vesicle synthesis protein GvpL/GvpF
MRQHNEPDIRLLGPHSGPMKVYVYALVDTAPEVDDLRGIEREPLEIVPLADGAAIVGRVGHVPPLSRERLDAQDHLIRALHDRVAALLPTRFGTVVADTGTLCAHSMLQPPVLSPLLARVHGREQMAVRIVSNRPSDEPLDPPSSLGLSGRQYLERRMMAATVPRETHELTAAVAALVRAEHSERGRVPGMVATVYHLIDRGRSEDYRAAMGAGARLKPELSVIISGPAPAYAFGRIERF